MHIFLFLFKDHISFGTALKKLNKYLNVSLVLFPLSKHCLEREVRGACGSGNSLTLVHIHSNPENGLNMLSMS